MMIPLLRERSNQSVILDIGCGRGEFACILSLVFDTIGLDVKKYDEFRLLKKSKRLNFVIADVRFLPFRYGSIDVAVCNSILEHCRNLENDMKKIANVLKKDGVLVGGYPVETALFKFVWKRVSPRRYSVIDMEGARKHAWINPWTGRKENYWEKPSTHKQTYQSIRHSLGRCFRLVQKSKLPFAFLPDELTYYECFRCTRG